LTVQIVANPFAGRGRAARLIPVVEQRFRSAGIEFKIHHTRSPWHAADITEALSLAGHEFIVALGGDGTTNEVTNGLLRAAQITGRQGVVGTLGIIPAGSGNDSFYPLGLEGSVEAASCG
jgi:diacylglycerol kinase (ATP)